MAFIAFYDKSVWHGDRKCIISPQTNEIIQWINVDYDFNESNQIHWDGIFIGFIFNFIYENKLILLLQIEV